MSIPEVLALDIVEYWQYYRDGYVHRLNQTGPGREYLEQCWLMEQTQPDREALKAKFKAQS